MAIASMILGIISIFFPLFGIIPITGLILGIKSYDEGGKFSKVGIVLSSISLIAMVISFSMLMFLLLT